MDAGSQDIAQHTPTIEKYGGGEPILRYVETLVEFRPSDFDRNVSGGEKITPTPKKVTAVKNRVTQPIAVTHTKDRTNQPSATEEGWYNGPMSPD